LLQPADRAMNLPPPKPPGSRNDLRKQTLLQQSRQQVDPVAVTSISEDDELSQAQALSLTSTAPEATTSICDEDPLKYWDRTEVVDVPSRRAPPGTCHMPSCSL
jgi:hypothetical protein